jgi:hypothetical protein
MRRRHGRRRKQSTLSRVARRIRALFSSTPPDEYGDDVFDQLEGGLGVREPRRPLRPSTGGAVALDVPPPQTRDVWAVGEEDGG